MEDGRIDYTNNTHIHYEIQLDVIDFGKLSASEGGESHKADGRPKATMQRSRPLYPVIGSVHIEHTTQMKHIKLNYANEAEKVCCIVFVCQLVKLRALK